MKEKQIISILDSKELQAGCIYMTEAHDLVQIRSIDQEKNKLHIYSIKDSCNLYIDLNRHKLVKKIR
jgi:hypothetical protein